MSDPTFGISITRIDNEPRPAVWSDMSVVGLIGTAPAADAATFTVDTPVFMYSDDVAKRHALGATGTIPEALALITGAQQVIDCLVEILPCLKKRLKIPHPSLAKRLSSRWI